MKDKEWSEKLDIIVATERLKALKEATTQNQAEKNG